ncbi:MAG TPA: hypothetical protein VGH28_22910 [Polyangiaceae bacterium]|jgi:hypothetical protein
MNHVHDRSNAEQATLDDVDAMLAAAQADAAVKGKLGAGYLATVTKAIAHARGLAGDSAPDAAAQIAESEHVKEIAHALVQTMRDIRDAGKLAELSPATMKTLGEGAAWHENRPAELQIAATELASSLAKNPKLAAAAHVDKQHRHDLVQGAAALLEAHHAHGHARADRKDHSHAREAAFDALRAMAHHIRLAARLAHRGDEAALERFESPVPVHKIVTRAKPAPAPSPAS